MSKLILFDMDGTLVTRTTKHIPDAPHPILHAMNSVEIDGYSGNISKRGLKTSGMTDTGIVSALWKLNGVRVPPCDDKTICEMIANSYEILINDGRVRYVELPFVNELLRALSLHSSSPVIGLLTGNVERAVPMKLANAGIDRKLFACDVDSGRLLGAYGSDASKRPDLVRIAKRRYAHYCGLNAPTCTVSYDSLTVPCRCDTRIPDECVVIVGDTPLDIECAHVNGVPCVAVATGNFAKEALRGADVVLTDFSDTVASVKAILSAKYGGMAKL